MVVVGTTLYLISPLQYESQNESLLSNFREVKVHKQELEQVLTDLKDELDDLRTREKTLLSDESRGSASDVKQAMEMELEEREARHTVRVQKLQAEITEKEGEITNITK